MVQDSIKSRIDKEKKRILDEVLSRVNADVEDIELS